VSHPTTLSVADGDAAAMALYAGQSVGLVRERMPAARIVGDMVRDAERAMAAFG
jgi:hypothetical protein